MPGEIVMPRMGLTMETGTVVRWLKKEGEGVVQGEPLLEIETDKATVEIEALEGGTLYKIVAGIGEEIPVGGVIAYLLKPGETAEGAVERAEAGKATQYAVQPQATLTSIVVGAPSVQKAKASPAARRLAKNLGVQVGAVQGSGAESRARGERSLEPQGQGRRSG